MSGWASPPVVDLISLMETKELVRIQRLLSSFVYHMPAPDSNSTGKCLFINSSQAKKGITTNPHYTHMVHGFIRSTSTPPTIRTSSFFISFQSEWLIIDGSSHHK